VVCTSVFACVRIIRRGGGGSGRRGGGGQQGGGAFVFRLRASVPRPDEPPVFAFYLIFADKTRKYELSYTKQITARTRKSVLHSGASVHVCRTDGAD